MKKLSCLSLISLAFIFNLQAQKSTAELDQSNLASSDYEVSIGYVRDSLTDTSNDSLEGNGLDLALGVGFDLPSNFSTTTSANFKYISYDGNKFLPLEARASGASLTFTSLEAGLHQKIAYDVDVSGFILRPYGKFGVARRTLAFRGRANGIEVGDADNTTVFNFGAGIHFISPSYSTFAPYVEYSRTNLDFEDSLDSSIFHAGLSFLF